jgi:hypothetical protein
MLSEEFLWRRSYKDGDDGPIRRNDRLAEVQSLWQVNSAPPFIPTSLSLKGFPLCWGWNQDDLKDILSLT